MWGNKTPEAVSTVEQVTQLTTFDLKNLNTLAEAKNLDDMADWKKAKIAYDQIFNKLNTVIESSNFNESDYQKLFNAIENANKNAFWVVNPALGWEIIPKEIHQDWQDWVEWWTDFYTDKETTVWKDEIEEHWYWNEINKVDTTKTISLTGWISCTYKLNTSVYKKEIETDNWFFENWAEIWEYEFKKDWKVLKRDTISIKEQWDKEYIELDWTNVDWYDFDDYDKKIDIGVNGKPDLEGTLEKLIRYYFKEEPDDLEYDDQVKESKITKITKKNISK